MVAFMCRTLYNKTRKSKRKLILKKQELIETTLTHYASLEKTIACEEDKKIFFTGGLVGQRVLAKIKKVKKDRAEGIILKTLHPSEEEIKAQCIHFGQCGGCRFQNLPYEQELKIKEQYIQDLFNKAGLSMGNYMGITPSPTQKGYRNKMEFSFGDEVKGGELCLGMHKKNAHYSIVSCEECQIIDEDYQRILCFTQSFFRKNGIAFYNKITKQGILRHLLVRKAWYTKEILLCLVATTKDHLPLQAFVQGILSLPLQGTIKGILLTQNTSFADAIINQKTTTLYGQDFITEQCLGLTYKITAFSFFQTNTRACENLYQTVLDFCEDFPVHTVFDLYCGTGTMTQLLARRAKESIGIEIIQEAIEAAKSNAAQNGITNCSFLCGDVLHEVEQLKKHADLIILDPPRSGIQPKALQKILAFSPQAFIYVSCKASSLIKELPAFLENGYNIQRTALIDMFPRTSHVETVALLCKDKSNTL